MRFYGSASALAAALARAARASGCRVTSLAPSASMGAYTEGNVSCPSGWHAADMLLRLAREDAKTPGARRIAAMLRQAHPSDPDYVAAVHRFVRARVRFAPEVGEIFQNGGYTLASGVGDCDDHARLLIALYEAGGVDARLGLLHDGNGEDPSHAAGMACIGGECLWTETTVDARVGEHPLAAARRLGVVSSRKDLAKEDYVMGDRTLTTPPAGYLAANPPETLAKDVAALRALGLLAPCSEVSDAADPVFRAAILAAQLAAPPDVVRDGLTGPQTRAAMGAMLTAKGMGALADELVPKVVTHSKDISDGFLRKVIAMNDRFVARGARTKPEHWLAVWNGESGLRAYAKNAAGYGGLPGLNGQYLAKLGFPGTLAEWTALSPEDQLPTIERFYDSIVGLLGPDGLSLLDSPEAIYAWNFLPARAPRLREERPIFSRKEDPDRYYEDNVVLDIDGDGVIDLADLRAWVGRRQRQEGARWIEVRRRLYEQPGGDPGLGIAALATAAGTVGALVLAAYAAAHGWG